MDKRDGEFGAPPVMAVPPVHQMSRFDQPIPWHAGYASHHLSQLTGNHMAILRLHTLHLVTRMLTHMVLTLHLVLLLLDIPNKMHRSKSHSFKFWSCRCTILLVGKCRVLLRLRMVLALYLFILRGTQLGLSRN
ncbi:unnamed protein product [Musa acuminata subsp. malaccensis]|nr:unnamed protein product [Musa acuminata subsp. malaccensis]